MLTTTQVEAAEACFRTEPPLTHQQLRWHFDVLGITDVADRSEWFSRAGYAAAYGATARGIRAEAAARFIDSHVSVHVIGR